MSVHAAVEPAHHRRHGRHARPRPAWPRIAIRLVTAALALSAVLAVVGADLPPILLVVPIAVLLTLAAAAAKLRTASRKIDVIFAEELPPTRTGTVSLPRVTDNPPREEPRSVA